MKRFFLIFLMAVLALYSSVSQSQTARRKPIIITTTTDIAAIAAAVTGNGAEVLSLMKKDGDPDFVISDPVTVFRSAKADCLFRIGAELEDRWIQSFYTKTENQNIKLGALANITLSNQVNLMPVSSADGVTEPIIHKKGNPYIWLDPANGTRMAAYMCEYLYTMFPEWKEDYTANLKKFNKNVDDKMGAWRQKMDPWKDIKMVSYSHKFDYFAKRFNLNIVDYVQPAAGIPPTKQRIEQIVEKMKNDSIQYLIVSTNVSAQNYQPIIDATGATLIKLPVSVGVDWINDYIQLFDYITGVFQRTVVLPKDQAQQSQ